MMNLPYSELRHLYFRDNGHSGKVRCEPGWNWRPSQPIPDYDIWYALSGKGTMTINGTEYPVQGGSCFLLRPGDRVLASQDPEDRVRVIYIHFAILSPSGETLPPEALELPPPCTRLEQKFELEQHLNGIIAMEGMKEKWAEEEFDCRMKLVFIALNRMNDETRSNTRQSQSHRKAVQTVIEHIREHNGKPPDFERLGALVNMSARYLSSLFKQYTGLSLKEYVTLLRLERAKFLLSETSMSVTQIAEAVGYSDIYHFSKLFKSKYGCAPTLFRRNTIAAARHLD